MATNGLSPFEHKYFKPQQMNCVATWVGKRLASYLSKETGFKPVSPPSNPLHLQESLLPGDVLLVEGSSRISKAIKYLTHSTWSHAALFVGYNFSNAYPADCCLIEADIVNGVTCSSLEKYSQCHTRICRPIGLHDYEYRELIHYAILQLGHQYDLRNVFDIARYLLPNPPVPSRFRRQLLELGSGDPTRAICSTLIAQAFREIQYPILPDLSKRADEQIELVDFLPKQFHSIHHTFITPRDFDVSPYFEIVKPTIISGFNFHDFEWIREL
jgi:hypothetical protein